MDLKLFSVADEGVTAIEYAFLGGLIAVVIIGGVTSVGGSVEGLFDRVADCVQLAFVGRVC
ncbi:MAG: Flp family type IVb pilin [Burkholderiaceae bacterium]|jgi:pilus assembly protein Flp/PilA|nr:Flp family type IVb pilin [Burkholderiaceae bacterium]